MKKQAEKILSLDSIWKNRDEKFKEMTIQIMANSLRYAENHNIKNKEMAIIGDQLFTDIKGAKRFGCYSILVDPINNDEHIFTKINRLRELRLQKKMKDFERGKYYG